MNSTNHLYKDGSFVQSIVMTNFCLSLSLPTGSDTTKMDVRRICRDAYLNHVCVSADRSDR
jgi:hypothetical protein